MVKSELINIISAKQPSLSLKDVELSVNQILDYMTETLSQGGRIEIRGFGSFNLHYRPARNAHNPKTGEKVAKEAKYTPHFKPGKEMRERVNKSYGQPMIGDTDEDNGE
jgi:integration host factor subunit beta